MSKQAENSMSAATDKGVRCACRSRYSRADGFHVRFGPLCASCVAKKAAADEQARLDAEAPKRAQVARSAAIAAILDDVFAGDPAARTSFILATDSLASDLDSIRAAATAHNGGAA